MPLTYVRRFRVRHYECDPTGCMNNVNYLRYMQEAAIEASAAAGYDLAWYAQAGHHWLVRETDIEYLRPLSYGDTVEVRTWVADFRRVRSHRAYELWSVAAGAPAARALTDWVYVNTATGAPAPIPVEMEPRFAPEGLSGPVRREKQAAPPALVFSLRRRVRFHELDLAQHVNNANYLAYAEDCGLQAATSLGWPSRLAASGLTLLVQRQHIVYLASAVRDDEVDIDTWLSDVEGAGYTRHYRLRRVSDGARLAEVHSFCVLANSATLEPRPVAADFAEANR